MGGKVSVPASLVKIPPEPGHRLQFSRSSDPTSETPQKAKPSYGFGVTTHLNGRHGHRG